MYIQSKRIVIFNFFMGTDETKVKIFQDHQKKYSKVFEHLQRPFMNVLRVVYETFRNFICIAISPNYYDYVGTV